MLYVSTRNTADTYTAYRALYEHIAPDGGFYVPFHLPSFSDTELSAIRQQSCADTIAQILNLLFGLHLSGWDVECAIGRDPFRLECMHHKLTVAELFRNPEAAYGYLLKNLYSLMTGGESTGKLPSGWSYVGIVIALLFGIYSTAENMPERIDIAVTCDNFADLAAISYGKVMGLPIDLIVCTSKDNSALWDLVNRGECDVRNIPFQCDTPDYFECFLYNRLGQDAIQQYLTARVENGNFCLDEQLQTVLNDSLFTAVVSADRVESVVKSVYRTNQYSMSANTALAFSGLQDYRSATGVSKDTLILAKNRPDRIKE